MIPQVVASERGRAQTIVVAMPWWGCRTTSSQEASEDDMLESMAIAGESPMSESSGSVVVSWVARDTWNPVWIRRAHPPRLNTRKRPIVNQYREGKVKSTSSRGVKEFLKPYAYKRSEHVYMWRRAFCIMNLRVTVVGKVKCHETRIRSESESE